MLASTSNSICHADQAHILNSSLVQWAAFLAFRATDVFADLGYVQYIFVGQHRGK